MIKELLRKNLYSKYFIEQYHYLAGIFHPLLFSDEFAIKRYYKMKSGKNLNLEKPITFSEKQQYYKLQSNDELKKMCADKYLVRNYIIENGYESLLNEIYAIYEEIDQLKIEKLPNEFVLKATHGSGFNLIIKDKNEINWFMWKKIMKSWLRQNIYWSGRETVYKNPKPLLIAEKYLEDESGDLKDYKFYCFNGSARFMQLEIGRSTNRNIRNFYDVNWNLLPFGKGIPHREDVNITRPHAFEEMIKIAEKLSKPFSFVRVDLYQVNNKVFFGELTFFPAGGAPDFIPSEYDEIVGKMWSL